MTDKLLASNRASLAKHADNIRNDPNLHHGPYIPKSKYRWYNNGEIEGKFIKDTQPINWVPGRLNSVKEKISKSRTK